MGRPAIVWNADNTKRLLDACRRVPAPSDDEIARELGTTVGSVVTAKSLYGVSARRDRVVDGQQRERKCPCCGRPFVSRHHGNRICGRCKKV